jgi:hypothetical protein
MRSYIDGLIAIYGPVGAGVFVGLIVAMIVCAIPFFLALVLSQWV